MIELLFWFVRRQLRETAEMSCDALAIAATPESRHDYAELLLQLSSQNSDGVPAPVIAVGAGNARSFERRLNMILSSNVSGKLSWSGALTIAVLSVIAIPYWSLAQSANPEPNLPPIAQSNAEKDTPKEAEPEPMTSPQRYGDHGNLTDVRFVNDDKEVVTVSIEGGVNVRRWNVASKQLLSEIKLASDEHGRDVRQGTLQLSADGRNVVAATNDYVGIWDAVSGDLQQKFAIPKKEWEYDCVLCLDISRDGSRMVASLGTTYMSGRVWNGHAIVWDVPSGKEINRVTYQNNFHFVDIDLSSDGKLFATCNEMSARVCIWEADSGKLLLETLQGDDWQSPDPDLIKNNMISDVAFSPDDSLLAMSGTFGIRLVEVRLGKRLRQIDAPYSYHTTTGLEFSADGKRLARNGTGVKGIESSYAVPVFDTESGQMLFALKTEADAIRFSANSKLLAVAGSDRAGALSIWPVTGDVITSLPVATVPPVQFHRIDSVEANTHYRGKIAEDFANRWNPSWGEAQNGIQYGVALTTGSNSFRVRERVLMAAFVRNVSDIPQHIDLRPDMYWNVPQVVHSDGTAVKIEKRALLGTSAHYRDTLEPGEVFGPLYLNVGLGDNPRPQLQNWSPWIPAPAIGKYQLTHSIPLQVADSNATRDGNDTVWTPGKLVSGVIEFEIPDRVAVSGRSNFDVDAPVDPVAVTAETVTGDDSRRIVHGHDHTEKPVSWIPARPLKTTVSTGSAIIFPDHSVGLEGDVTWQEATTHFAFNNSTTLDELRLELLPVDSPAGPQYGRGGEKLILFDVKAELEKQTGEWTSQEFSSCVSLLNPDDETTTNCIDNLSDTGWTVSALSADAEAYKLVLKFDEPVTLQPGERLVLSVDSGGSKEFAVLNRIRFAFHQAATETGTVVLHAIDADTCEPIRDVEFVKENAVGEDWATLVGRSDTDGTVRIETKPILGYFFSILPEPQGYKVTSLDEVPVHVEVGRRVDYRFHLRKLGTNLEFVKNVPASNAAGNRFAEALKETNQTSFRIAIDDMPGFRGEPVTFIFARDRAPLAERIFANGELVRAAVHDELRYFQKAEGKSAGNISELYYVQVVISSTSLPRAPATSWYLYCRTRDGIELKQDGFKFRFEDLDHWDLEIPAFLHPEF